MHIYECIQESDILFYSGDPNMIIDNLSINSNNVTSDSLFIAVEGEKRDGHDYILSAIKNGVRAILINEKKLDIFSALKNITILTCKNTRKAVAFLSQKLYDFPAGKVSLIGVTGTNGKTSIASISYYMMLDYYGNTAFIGTLGEFINDTKVDINKTTVTTPDSIEFAKFLHTCVENDIKNVVMEVSSMALKLNRLGYCQLDIGLFTNISPEHMVEHKTFEDYLASKKLLFSITKYPIINIDDCYGKEIAEELDNRSTYSIENTNATVYASNIMYRNNCACFNVHYRAEEARVSIPIPAKFAVSNALAIISICLAKGMEFHRIIPLLEKHYYVAGRYDEILIRDNIRVIIDYAHNPTAYENLLSSIVENREYRKLITVFGCHGNFDYPTRPKMGAIADTYSDCIIITSDDPHEEDPISIIEGIKKGIHKKVDVTAIIPSRRQAIKRAIEMAESNDIIVITGKGHETTQNVNGIRIPHNDKEVVLEQ